MKLFVFSLILLVFLQALSYFDPERLAKQQLERRGYHYSIPQFLEVASTGNNPILALFGKAGMDPNATDPEGNSALIAASEQGHGAIVQMLLGAGADPTLHDGRGRSALIAAAFGGHPDVVTLLLNKGLDRSLRSDRGWNALSIAAYKGNAEVVRLLVDSVGQEQLDEAYQLALENGDRETLSILRERGARHNDPEEEILRAAAIAGELPIQRTLISKQETKRMVSLNESTIRNLASDEPIVESLYLSSFRKQTLPLRFCDINDEHAVFQLTNSEGKVREVTVLAGAMIPETRYRVDKMQITKREPRLESDRRIEVARVRIQNVATGANHLLVKEADAEAADICGIVTAPGSGYQYVAKKGDIFRTVVSDQAEREYQVIEIRPSGVVVKDLTSDRDYILAKINRNQYTAK